MATTRGLVGRRGEMRFENIELINFYGNWSPASEGCYMRQYGCSDGTNVMFATACPGVGRFVTWQKLMRHINKNNPKIYIYKTEPTERLEPTDISAQWLREWFSSEIRRDIVAALDKDIIDMEKMSGGAVPNIDVTRPDNTGDDIDYF